MKIAVTTGPNWKSLVFVSKIVIEHKSLEEIVHISYINRFGSIYTDRIDRIIGTDWFNNEYL